MKRSGVEGDLEPTEKESDIRVALEAGEKFATLAAKPHSPAGGLKISNGIPFVLLPEGMEVESLEHLLPPPEDRRADVEIVATDSFIRYFDDYKVEGVSRIFGLVSESSATFSAVLDYHQVGAKGAPGWGHHRVLYSMKLSPEWKRWIETNGEKMDQVSFAQMVEDRVPDFVKPEGGVMLTMALGFEAKPNVSYKSHIRLENGDVQLSYEDTSNATAGNEKIPSKFTFKVPVFFGEPAVEITARLRFRINGGAIKLWYEIERPHEIIKEGFDMALARIETECKTKITLGVPTIPKVNL